MATEAEGRAVSILAAARALLTEGGREGLTMARLGQRAGCAKGTLYLYFTSREDVVLRLYALLLEEVIAALCAFRAETPAQQVALIARAVQADPLFLPLLAQRLEICAIGTPPGAHKAVRRAEVAALRQLATHLAALPGGSPDRATLWVRRGAVVLAGLAQVLAGKASRFDRLCREMLTVIWAAD